MYLSGYATRRGYVGDVARLGLGDVAGLGLSTNEAWVNNYQNPFNNNSLFPITKAVGDGTMDKATGYRQLSAAYEQIKRDAVAFVGQFSGMLQSSAQATVDRWRSGDGPLIEGFLRDWSQAIAAPATQPVQLQPAAPIAPVGGTTLVYSPPAAAPADSFGTPSIGGSLAPGAPATVTPSSFLPAGYAPAPAASEGVLPAAGSDFLTEWGPWIAGAVVLGFALSSGGGRRRSNGG